MERGRMTLIAGLKTALELASLVSFIIGAGFAYAEFTRAQDDKKRDRTMEYIRNFEEGRVAEARYALNIFIAPLWEGYERGKVTQLDYDDWRNDFLDQVDNDPNPFKVRADIDMVVGFYDSLQACVDNNLCDEIAADKYFNDYNAPEFWDTFWPHILYRCGQNNPSYGQTLIRRAGKIDAKLRKMMTSSKCESLT